MGSTSVCPKPSTPLPSIQPSVQQLADTKLPTTGQNGATWPVVDSIAPDGLVAVRRAQNNRAPQSPTINSPLRCRLQHHPELTAGMRLISVDGKDGHHDVSGLSFKQATGVFRTAGRPCTLTLRASTPEEATLSGTPSPN